MGRSVLPRSPGLHISEIYGDLYRRLEPERYGKGEPNPLLLEAGLSLETVIEDGLKGRLGHRPGEVVSPEGIISSPDLVLVNGHIRVGEIKCTWMSCREMPIAEANVWPQKFSRWNVQMMWYCSELGLNHARLIGFFVNGNYKPPQPKLLAWDVEYTDRELQENRQMLLRHAVEMGVVRDGKVVTK